MNDELVKQENLIKQTNGENKKLIFYNINVTELLKKYKSQDIDDEVISDLMKQVDNGEIWFPFQKYFRGIPHELFANLKTITLKILLKPYKLYSYYPKYKTYLPPKFRGNSIVIIGTRETYFTADVLSDHFVENIRLKAKRHDQQYSILECWNMKPYFNEIIKLTCKKGNINPETLRDSIYETIPETKIFNPTWARTLLKIVMGDDLKDKKWLDISAGYGDRLIAAMSLDMKYLGYDPNIELKEGHSKMIKLFGDSERHQVIYEPFEKATIPEGPYDVILSSPPYYTVEEYAPNQQGQSIVSYPNFNQWMVWFLFASLIKAWDNLKDNGYLILHLGDSKMIHICESTNIFIENNLPQSSWEGIIGLQGESAYTRPVWVWKKVSKNTKRILWKSSNREKLLNSEKRTLFDMYPCLQMELIKFYGAKFNPNYLIRKNNAELIRNHVISSFPNISKENINILLNDDLLISSLLETLSVEDTIKWAIEMIKISF